MKFILVSIFPDFFGSALSTSLLGKAIEKGIVEVEFINPRDFTKDIHGSVDDLTFGGGAGMVMMPEPLALAIDSAKDHNEVSRAVAMSPRGVPFSQDLAKELAGEECLLMLCGRYEGIDQRIIDGPWIDQEISLGDFVLAGGEVAALTMIESITRLIPEVMGNSESLEEESHCAGRLEYPHYTRPRDFRGMKVPDILLSGHHANVANWRKLQSIKLTKKRRPDLLESNPLSKDEQKLLDKSV